MRLRMIFAVAAFLLTTVSINAQGIISPRHRTEATKQTGKDEPVPTPLPALPVSEINIGIKIDGQIATVTVDHLFRNDGDENLEGTYYFPVPENATLMEFAIYDDDQRRVGRVKEKAEARADYAAAVAQGQDPALLEMTRNGWFHAYVYPIPPHADKHIQIIYSQVLMPKNGTSTFDYPLGNGYKKLKIPVSKVDINMDLRATTPIKNVFSPSHPLLLDYDGEKHVTGKLETSGGGDAENFQLVYSLSDSEVSATLITYRREGEDGYFLLMLSPKLNFDDRKISAKDVLFVIDVSGSMDGVRLEQAKEALRFGLSRTLNEGDRFNIIAFSSNLTYMQKGLAEATSVNINNALNFVNKLKADGGTAINEALVKSMKLFEENARPKNLVFLTDGQPTDGETRTDQIVKNVASANTAQARLNAFGVGSGVNNLLLERLALENRGAQSTILNESELSNTISEFFAKVSKTVLSNLEVSFGPVAVDRLHPAQLPDLYTRSQIKIYGRYKNLVDLKDITVTLTGLMNGETQRFDFNGLDFPLVTDDKPFLPKLWATERVNALMAEQRIHGEKPEIKQEVLSLAKEFNLITRYTSMYVPSTVQLERERVQAISQGIASQSGVSQVIAVSASSNSLQTQSAYYSTNAISNQSENAAFSSANAMNVVQITSNNSTMANQNQAAVNGLSNNALNVTLDGINLQNNFVNANNGFFANIQPKTNAVQEVTVQSAAGSVSDAQGAMQVKFVTRAGTNSFSGSLYDYLQNPVLNANYYFNNQSQLPRSRIMLNQFGGRLGGPIIKDKAFFFVNYEEYHLPEAILRQRTIMSVPAQSGIFSYLVGNSANSVNLFSLAAANGLTATSDPTVTALLSQIRATTNRGSVQSSADPNLQRFSFLNGGNQLHRSPTVRLDFNINSRHRLENVYNYQGFASAIDFLNGSDPAFPGFPNFGTQSSTLFSNSATFSSILSPAMANEIHFGISGGTIRFLPEVNPIQFTNQGGLNLNLSATGMTNATVQTSPQRRNSPVRQFADDLSWVKAQHYVKLGFAFSQTDLFSQTTPGGVVPTINFGVIPNDPADSIFSTANFPGASPAQLNQARAFYALLTGRITGVDGTAALSEDTSTYVNHGKYTQRIHQRDMGTYASDSWRVTSNLTFTGGLRWEVEFPFTAQNQSYAQTTVDQLFGISGAGNIFKPGTTNGKPTEFTALVPGARVYNTQWGNFAPSVGFAWSPNLGSPNLAGGPVHRIFGEYGQSVIRAGYSISYVHEGVDVMAGVYGSNPGGILNTGVSANLGNLNTTPTLLRNGAPPLISPVASPVFPIVGNLGNQANAFIPDLKTGRVHSWAFGFQREINRDTVLEFRYVGNRAMGLWRRYSINETDVQSNGFLNEFNLAKQNLMSNNATGGARTGSFAYFGPNSGTSPLPTILGWFNGLPSNQAGDPSKYSSGLFRSATFTNTLSPALPSALGFANVILANPGLFLANGAAAGLPANYFVVNPGISSNAIGGGSFVVDNSNRSYYDAFVIELRRRLSRGLLFNVNYTFSKSMANNFGDDATHTSNFVSLHDKDLNRGISPFNISHALKTTFIYELPFGQGLRYFKNSGSAVDRLVGGWAVHGTARIQSGAPFSFGNVQLVGMTRQQLQNAVQIQHGAVTANGLTSPAVFWLPSDIVQNTINAFNGSFSATGRYIAPANMNGAIAYPGATGFSNLILSGPRFTRFDLSFVKKIKITDRINFELRTELMNAFNNINFRIANQAGDSSRFGDLGTNTFGQTMFAYQDQTISNDPGGRLIQFVARLNF